jgi:diguanylate cyclase (GGDEF)-like protein/PAS domain S-box-containing protein
MPSGSILPWTRHRRWPVAGFLFGLLFPVMGTGMEIARRNVAVTWDVIFRLHAHTPLLWMIDLAPLILGIVGWFILTPRGAEYLNTGRARLLPPALTLLAVLPVALLIFALCAESLQARMVGDANRSGSLRYRSLWLYGATRRTPDIPVKDAARWPAVLKEMVQVREGLRQHYPRELARTDDEWHAFSTELKATRRVSWAVANRMRVAANALTQEIETAAQAERAFSLVILSLGMLGVAVSLLVSLDLLRHLRQAESSVQGDRDFINAIVNTAQSVIAVIDARGNFVRFNGAAERLTGYKEAEVRGKHYSMFLPPEEHEAVLAKVGELSPDETTNTYENHWVTRSGERRLLSWSSAALLDEKGNLRFLIGTALDITERREQEKRMEALAITDGLTGVANRRAFDERLALEVTRAARYDQPLSLVLLDIDRFKSFNDTFGHQSGDDVLRQVAVLLAGAARETDFVARYGGEEFVVVLPHTDHADALAQAERFRVALEVAPWLQRAITGSFGVATWSPAVTTGEELVAEADRALYQAKRTRNAVRHADDRYFLLTPAARDL